MMFIWNFYCRLQARLCKNKKLSYTKQIYIITEETIINNDNNTLFKGEILDDNQSWQSFVRSTEAFTPLIKHIYQINNLKLDEISYITLASSAVFRIGDKVIKIFYPPEAGFRYQLDYEIYEYETEVAVMNHAKNVGVLAPRIIYNGIVKDGRYSFGYIITNYIDGIMAREAIYGFNDDEKKRFAFKMREILSRFNVVNTNIKIARFDEPARFLRQDWNNYPESFKTDRNKYIKNLRFPELVVVQTDLNGRNIIIDKQGDINLLDFAESMVAPYYYDWTSILFLFNYDKIMIKEYFGDYNDEFYETMTQSLLLRTGVMESFIAKDLGVDVKNITDVTAFKNTIIKWFESDENFNHEYIRRIRELQRTCQK